MNLQIFNSKLAFSYFIFFFFFSSCTEEPEYKNYKGGWIDVNYSIKGSNNNSPFFKQTETSSVAAANNDVRFYVFCEGEGSRCEVGGPKDGVLLPAPVEINVKNIDLSISRKSAGINMKAKLMNAYASGNLVNEIINPDNHLFDEIKNRDEIFNNLVSGKYKITELQKGQFVIYAGHILEANFLYILNC